MTTSPAVLLDLKGCIFDIEHFAVHDGPGIRSLVFLKGCPLRCSWCANPESQGTEPELMYYEPSCTRCDLCVPTCPTRAITVHPDSRMTIEWQQCTNCGACVEPCITRALRMVGKHLSVAEVVHEVEKDRLFYRRSGGGVTLGGGEPALQTEFACALLKEFQKRFVHTAIETCGCVSWDRLNQVIRHCDLVYFDIKCMDATRHRELTGVSNELILSNAERVSREKPMAIRIPVIPGCNDSEENIRNTARFAKRLGQSVKQIELLPYHQFGESKYRRLGRKYTLHDTQRPGDDRVDAFRSIVEAYGIRVHIGQ